MENVTKKVIFDFILLCVVGFPILVLRLFVQPYRKGFFCDDESIRHPYKESTVNSFTLYCIGFGLPFVTMIILEWINYRRSSVDEVGSRPSVYLFGWKVPLYCYKLYCLIGIFIFGAACQQLVTDIGKYSIGRLRPHFYDVCKPNIDCNDSTFDFRYIEDYVCQTRDSSLEKESRLSFPSGHSSFSSYAMIFLVIYLQYKIKCKGSHLFKHLLQFGCIILSWYTALSRVSDYKHHPTDVLTGLLIGTSAAIITTRYVTAFKRTPKKQRSPNDNMSHSS